MPRIISPDEKISVIGDWFDGETREDIAIKHNIGSGTVYNIVQESSNSINIEKADVLIELAVKLKKNGLTVSDCAKGFRISMIFKIWNKRRRRRRTMIWSYPFFKRST